ncbi:MAG: Wzt carbohydrate-binding domain-containing protein, partial [Burkholderia gladioli]
TAELQRADGSRMLWAAGGEIATLRIEAVAYQEVEQAVVAFVVKDKLGRMLFGDHTYWTSLEQPLALERSASIAAEFEFAMPILTPEPAEA